jgi:hypothetical protein
MARKKTLLLVFAALLVFGALSLVLTNSELSTLELGVRQNGGGDPTHSQVVADWWREDRDLLSVRRHNPAAVVSPGLNVGRVLAKYDGKDERREQELHSQPAVNRPPHRDERILHEKNLAVQLNRTSHHGDVQKRLETLGRLRNRELRLDTATRELWLYLRDQLKDGDLSKTLAETEDLRSKLLHSVKEQLDLLSLHASDTQDAIDSFISEGWRDTLARETATLVQKRLHHLQNPENCDNAKKLLCRISKPCGFGCQIHHVAYCFIFAYATERMLVLDSSGWRYSGKWEAVFQPLGTSNCREPSGAQPWSSYKEPHPPQVIQAPAIESLGSTSKPSFLPMAVPADLVERLTAFHGYPFVWFVGQFLQYLMRPSQQLGEYLEERRKFLNISHPIVGVHIRRTDKLQQEASYHSVEEYMTQVEEWYDRRETMYGKKEEKRVYLATDDQTALNQAIETYPNYKFVSDNDVSKTAGELSSRYSEKGLYGVVLDVVMLSECDYIVCTLSSQVSIALELLQMFSEKSILPLFFVCGCLLCGI